MFEMLEKPIARAVEKAANLGAKSAIRDCFVLLQVGYKKLRIEVSYPIGETERYFTKTVPLRDVIFECTLGTGCELEVANELELLARQLRAKCKPNLNSPTPTVG